MTPGQHQPPSRYQLTALGIGTLEYLWAASDHGGVGSTTPS